MDVIINNPPAPQLPIPLPAQLPAQGYGQVQATGYGYGPMPYGQYQGQHGPGFLLPLLLIGAFVLFARRRLGRRFMAGGPGSHGGGPDLARSDLARSDLARSDMARSDMAQEMREKFRRGRDRFVNDSAQHIARERYARGEIDADEYEALRRTLSGEFRPDRPTDKPAQGSDLKL